MLEIRMLPARQGDAIWILWGNDSLAYQMMVDMGTKEVGRKFRERLQLEGDESSKFELLVISHVDSDHIGGALSCFIDEDIPESLEFKDIWFNGWAHLDGGQVPGHSAPGAVNTLEGYGPAQGELFSQWLGDRNWNKTFNADPVCRTPGSNLPQVTLEGGLKLTLLGPTPDRLSELKPVWIEKVQQAIKKGTISEVSPGLEPYGTTIPPILETEEDLKILAKDLDDNEKDDSEANGSSIILLLEYENRRILLSGDAFADDIVEGLSLFDQEDKVRLDAFKIPHHGSKNNITKELVEKVDCKAWLFSTDGTRFRHPDQEAIARIIAYSSSPVNLFFNVESTFNKWWDNPEWQQRYHYNATYGADEDGIKIKFQE